MPSLSKAQTKVMFYTSMGNFVAELYESKVPITANNFSGLVEEEFYDEIIFHRIIDDFVIQGGDPTGTGFGGSGVVIPDEFDSSLSNVQYTLSMANAGPNTGTSQFFINLVDNTYLDFDKPPFTSKHPVFGKVISGFEVVEAIGDVPVDNNDRPLTDVVMDSVRVISTSSVDHLEHIDLTTDLLIYPNPVTSESSIIVNVEREEEVEISLYDLTGRTIRSQQIQLNVGVNQLSFEGLEYNTLPHGTYYIRVSNETIDAQGEYIIAE